MNNGEQELNILESIHRAERSSVRLTQRDLAQASGLSLGMTNALLKSLGERGWIKLTRLSSRSVLYALTPEGAAEVTRRTLGFFRRASNSSSRYRERLEAFVMEAKRGGAETLVLAGSSELDFLVEYICERHGLVFVKSADPERARSLARRPGVTLLLSEQAAGEGPGTRLADLIAEVAADPEAAPALAGGVGRAGAL